MEGTTFSTKFQLGDTRLNMRANLMVSSLLHNPGVSLPTSFEKPSEVKAAYRFFSSKHFESEDITQASILETSERIASEPLVLLIQDTTDIDYSNHPATKGLGYLEKDYMLGIKCHSCMAVSQEGLPLGILFQKLWIRDNAGFGKKRLRQHKALHEKESYRWKQCIDETENYTQTNQRILHIADRESDIFDVFSAPRKENTELLIRAAQNRKLTNREIKLFEYVRSLPIAEEKQVTIKRSKDQQERSAHLEMRFAAVSIDPPIVRKKENLLPANMSILYIQETGANITNPIEWYLLTTMVIETVEQAWQCVRWYSLRWLIERFHYVLKEGCKIEELQLEEAERLKKAISLYSVVAWRLLYITYLNRVKPDIPATEIFGEDELLALYHFINKRGNTINEIPTIGEVVPLIARLGGFLGRKSDGSPGVKVLWRGLSKLTNITEAYMVFVKDVGNG